MSQFDNMITIWANLKFHKNGKKMKADNKTFPKGWNKTQKSIIRDDIKYKAVLTGRINNIIVIDFDVPKNNELDGIQFYHDNYELFKNTFIEKSISGKGYHVYYKYNPLFKSKNRINGDNGLSIDILNERGNNMPNMCIFGTPINNNEIQEMPEEVIKLFDIKSEMKSKNNANNNNLETEIEDLEKEYEDLEKVKGLINILTINESDNRDSWITIGMCLFNILEDKKEAFNIWDKFSRLSKKYNASDIQEQWNSFKDNKKTIKSLFYYCKNYKIKFNLWKKTYLNQKELDLTKIYEENNFQEHTIKLLNSEYFDLDISEWFLKEYENQFIYYDNKIYAYNGKFWEKHSDKSIIFNIIGNLYNKLAPVYEKLIKDIDVEYEQGHSTVKEYLANCLKLCKKKLKTTAGINSTNEFIINQITKNDNLFDLNENLLCFTNGTYDLDSGIFRESNPLDYITLCTQYDYYKSTQVEIDFVFEYLNKIMSCSKKRDILLLALASGLRGITMEKFFILTGAGRNSKDTLITYIMQNVLGTYYYLGNTGCITNIIKEGVNVALANLENKRFVVFNEPSEKETIKISTVKQLSGVNRINTRGLYSSKTDIAICPSMFLMCNDIPKLDTVDEAIKERLVIISFNSLFREADYFVENDVEVGKNDIFLADDSVKDKNFISKMKMPFMNILLDYFKILKNNGFKLGTLPDSIKNENKKYLINSDEFTSWLNSCYIKTNDKNDILKLKDIYKNYKQSDLYDNLNKNIKRETNFDYLKEKIKKNPNLRILYHERKQINGKDYRNILTNYKINTDNDEDYDDLDDLKFT